MMTAYEKLVKETYKPFLENLENIGNGLPSASKSSVDDAATLRNLTRETLCAFLDLNKPRKSLKKPYQRSPK